ncbi:hypothetical protein FY034_15640 [Trichlorobacter lovleyi]|uniref:hypothetical protein n=1 Tax=Trichlorobacter lovleyi TaxID=313985 RepID=UPI00223F1B5C|nr:hypothetical protein [Trichlorobacter lovleyi]QOX80307.1 hypothetical protein FY034_15640 [Trichlorobacter lovleyi]
MKSVRSMILAAALTLSFASAALATPTGQIWIPSPDAKGFKDATVNLTYTGRFSQKSAADAGASSYDVGAVVGVLPFENLKLEIGVDYLTSNLQQDAWFDNHPIYFNAKLATPEDAFGIKGMPAFAVGIYNMGTYDKPEVNGSTRQNIAYGLVGKTFPVIGRLSAGGYIGSERALATQENPKNNNTGVMASWDRSMTEISDKLWLAVDYMSGNNANGALSVGGSWTFTKNVTLALGVITFNPFYKTSNGEAIPGGKPAFTTQLYVNF